MTTFCIVFYQSNLFMVGTHRLGDASPQKQIIYETKDLRKNVLGQFIPRYFVVASQPAYINKPPFNLALKRIQNKENMLLYVSSILYTVVQLHHTLIKKEEKKFLTYKEIQKGAVAKSYLTNGLLIYD